VSTVWCEQGLHECVVCGVNKDCMNVLYVV
jgi:hypothetical protein